MSSAAFEIGEQLQKQFKRATVQGGPLQGARFLEVGWDDLRKAAKSYRSDPRFNQFAKRVLSEKALGHESNVQSQNSPAIKTWSQFMSSYARRASVWFWGRMKTRLGLVLFIFLILMIVLSRPLFYAVVAKTLVLSIRLALRRSIGLLVLLVDAILDEAANSLETALIVPPTNQIPAVISQQSQMTTPQRTFHELIMNALFTMIGLLIGHRLPRAARIDRNLLPTRLRVV